MENYSDFITQFDLHSINGSKPNLLFVENDRVYRVRCRRSTIKIYSKLWIEHPEYFEYDFEYENWNLGK